jgi:hypothetical protein
MGVKIKKITCVAPLQCVSHWAGFGASTGCMNGNRFVPMCVHCNLAACGYVPNLFAAEHSIDEDLIIPLLLCGLESSFVMSKKKWPSKINST